jgi:ketosteroid isomerase-like protein
MEKEYALKLAEKVLDAWNRQDVDAVVSCYTPDCSYVDPNTRGPVVGREAFRSYLTRLFEQWRMHWSLREFFPFREGDGGAFLWHAELTPASGGQTLEVDGMDLVVLRGEQLSRNEVYFDRMGLFS